MSDYKNNTKMQLFNEVNTQKMASAAWAEMARKQQEKISELELVVDRLKRVIDRERYSFRCLIEYYKLLDKELTEAEFNIDIWLGSILMDKE